MVTFMEFQPPNICSIERADSRDRNTGGQSTGNKGGGSGGGTHGGMGGFGGGQTAQSRAMSQALAGPMVTGLRGPLGPTGAAGFTNQTGPAGVATGQSNPGQVGTGGVGSNYEGARADYVANYKNDFASRAAKFLTGIGLREPDINNPSTYAHGLAHTAVDPVGAALGIGGMINPVVGLAGKLYQGAKLATGWDGPQVTLGDASPGIPGPGQGFNYSGVGPQGRFGQGVGTPNQNNHLGPGAGQGTQSAFGPPGGAPFGAQPTAPGLGASAAAPAAAPTFGAAHVPNHSLPQGYASLFPNSLSDQDKALLYAKALGGGMG